MIDDLLLSPENYWMWCVIYGCTTGDDDDECIRCHSRADNKYSVKLDGESE